MSKPSPSFKVNRAKKAQCLKMSTKPQRPFKLKVLENAKFSVLPTPIKSKSDTKEYKVLKLENGLHALLISDMASLHSAAPPRPTPPRKLDEEEDQDAPMSEGEASNSDDYSDEPSSDEGEHEFVDQAEEKLAACALSVAVGSFSDPASIQGMAHFVEHMVFMGSKKYPKENDFDSFIKKKGGYDNASTDCESTTFYFEIQEPYLSEAMDKFSQFFVSPLMRQSAMQREREAIQSEFSQALPVDGNRKDQLLGKLLPAGHPASTFMWGDKRSLAAPLGPEDEKLHAAAHSFRKRHYSAHRMTLAVQARLPLSVIEKYVLSTFSQIPSNQLPPQDFSQFLFSPTMVTQRFHGMYFVKPVNQVSELNLTWCMRSFKNTYKDKPHQYISWILGHEGKGSLLSYLRKKVWALAIYTGSSDTGIDHNSLFCLFTITLVLTQEGLDNKYNVLDAVFCYINMLRKECPCERIFDEIKRVEDISFEFAEEPNPTDHVEALVENMHHFPPEHYITGQQIYYDYEPKSIMYVLEQMVPRTVNIMLLSQSYSQPVEYDQVEEWFGTEYRREEIPASLESRWEGLEPLKDFHLPLPNLYITDNFDLIQEPKMFQETEPRYDAPYTMNKIRKVDQKPNDSLEACLLIMPNTQTKNLISVEPDSSELVNTVVEYGVADGKNYSVKLDRKFGVAQKCDAVTVDDEHCGLLFETRKLEDYVTLLRNDDVMQLWHQPDYKFKLPHAFIYMHFVSNMTLSSAKDVCLLELWCSALSQLFTEELYGADMAGLSYGLAVGERGLLLTLHGFSQKLHLLVDVITKEMKNYGEKLSSQLFDAIKDIQAKSYHNTILKPHKLVKDVRLSILLQTTWSSVDKLNALQQIRYEDLLAAGAEFLKRLRVQVLVQGNLTHSSAKQIANTAHENLQWGTLTEEDRPKMLVHRLPAGTRYCLIDSYNPSDSNSVVHNYYQAGAFCLRDSCIIDFVMMLMEEPLFDSLRTKEQLGYTVECSPRYTHGVLGFCITVNTQADKYSTEYVDGRIENFLLTFGGTVSRMSGKTFEQTRRALVKNKKAVDVELKEEVSRNWAEVTGQEYCFNRLAQEVECLEKLRKEDVQRWYQDYVMSGSGKHYTKLSIQVIGKKKAVKKDVEDKESVPDPGISLPADIQRALLLNQLCTLRHHTRAVDASQQHLYVMSVPDFKSTLEVFPEKRCVLPEVRLKMTLT